MDGFKVEPLHNDCDLREILFFKTEKEAMDYCYQIDPEVRREIGFGKVIDQKTNKTVAEFPFLLAQVDLDLIDDDDDED